jgi:YVTN family beta-propeller protein
VHGIALVPEFNRGYVSNGTTNDVAIFDTKTLAVIGRVAVGKKPDAIIYDASTKRVIVNNGSSDDSTILNAADGKVTGTVALGGGPEFAAADGKGKIYVNLEAQNEMVKFDALSLRVEARWPLAPCKTPTSLAMDTATRRLFVGCRSGVMAVVDADTGKVVTTRPIGGTVDATVFDPATKLIYLSCGDGTVSIFREDSANNYSAVETLKTEPGAKTMALDPKTKRIFLSVAERKARVVVPNTFHVLVYGH